MGKNLIQQKQGKGSSRYRAPSHRYVGKITFPTEKNAVVTVKDIIHCPGHSAPLAQIVFNENKSFLIPAVDSLAVSSLVEISETAPLKQGNILPLKNIPEGTNVCAIEKMPGSGPTLCRSSGSFAQIIAKTPNKVTVILPSKKQATLSSECRAVIGIVAGAGKKEKPWVKAGKKAMAMKAKNKLYPHTHGVAMNACNHPFGSGRGRHIGKAGSPPRFASPGRKVGLIHARRTGRKRK